MSDKVRVDYQHHLTANPEQPNRVDVHAQFYASEGKEVLTIHTAPSDNLSAMGAAFPLLLAARHLLIHGPVSASDRAQHALVLMAVEGVLDVYSDPAELVAVYDHLMRESGQGGVN